MVLSQPPLFPFGAKSLVYSLQDPPLFFIWRCQFVIRLVPIINYNGNAPKQRQLSSFMKFKETQGYGNRLVPFVDISKPKLIGSRSPTAPTRPRCMLILAHASRHDTSRMKLR